jgi:uncharacterized protein (TIGR02757 family)
MTKEIKKKLEKLYCDLNRREFVSPDPLQFLYSYKDPLDIEIAGLVASSLAYGRVAQILKSVEKVLSIMGNPSQFLKNNNKSEMLAAFSGFKHRFTTGDEMAVMLFGAKRAIEEYGSLGCCFAAGISSDDTTLLPAMALFVREMDDFAEKTSSYLLPSPESGSACKRLNLYLRWMVRKDAVDLGVWSQIDPSKLIIPIDTHMYKIGTKLGFTCRKQPNLMTAVEITRGFREILPEDPVKYDFALTRLGIHSDRKISDGHF